MWLTPCRDFPLLFSHYMWLVPLRNSSIIACSWCLEKSCIHYFWLHLILTLHKDSIMQNSYSAIGILVLLLSIVCILHTAKSCFCWLNIACCSHFSWINPYSAIFTLHTANTLWSSVSVVSLLHLALLSI